DHEVDEREQPDQKRDRAALIGLDMCVETVGHSPVPQPPSRRRALRLAGVRQNFTLGACSSCGRDSPASKNSRGPKPGGPANTAAGNCWMPVLYSCTVLLKKRRAAAILFSISESSACSCWKLALALRSG